MSSWTRELHLELKEKELISLNDEGLFVVPEDIDSWGIDIELVDKYNKYINVINMKVQDGILNINSNLELSPIDPQEVADKVYKKDQKEQMASTMSTYLNVKHWLNINF